MHIWQDDLIVEPLRVEGGYVGVPTGPGLGVTL
jgi:L-alanine-DL-glutamate epimerase-like enolase superfamily enzyme